MHIHVFYINGLKYHEYSLLNMYIMYIVKCNSMGICIIIQGIVTDIRTVDHDEARH